MKAQCLCLMCSVRGAFRDDHEDVFHPIGNAETLLEDMHRCAAQSMCIFLSAFLYFSTTMLTRSSCASYVSRFIGAKLKKEPSTDQYMS
ncbi:hypothetical protein V5799_022431 [Amblyomma americanum]|uniref:Uncharacterized protein n=1 Tax=Amblyomma americanum TaxID=6943 RepID=A0AAQ4FLY9_AMBAM